MALAALPAPAGIISFLSWPPTWSGTAHLWCSWTRTARPVGIPAGSLLVADRADFIPSSHAARMIVLMTSETEHPAATRSSTSFRWTGRTSVSSFAATSPTSS